MDDERRSGMRSLNGADLIVENGGVVSNQDALIAWLATTTSDIDLTGAGSQWNSSGSVYLGGQAPLPGGTGDLRVSSGAEMHVDRHAQKSGAWLLRRLFRAAAC